MLIPFIDVDPMKAAAQVPNSYVNKLVQECFQMFVGAIYHRNGKNGKMPAYGNHPFTLWVAHSEWAWDWLMEFARCLATVEYPFRFPEKQQQRAKKGEPPYNKFWYRIQELEKPNNFDIHTMEETTMCPLPKKAPDSGAKTHRKRTRDFRAYHIQEKNQDRWQFLWEPRTVRPEWMPERNQQQEEIVKKTKKRLRIK